MSGEIIVIPSRPSADDPGILRAVQILRSGGLVAVPTETVYGLCCALGDESAAERVREAKGRPADRAIAVLVESIEQATQLGRLPVGASRLLEAYWPGPLTVVVASTSAATDYLGAEGTVGLRCPDHPVALALIRALGAPLVATSANRSGEPPAQTADEVISVLGEHLAAILTTGEPSAGSPSTVLDLTAAPPRILRLGALTEAELLPYLESMQ